MNSALLSPQVLSPAAQARSRRALVIVAASMVVAAAAHVVFPLPFSPVPLSLQPMAVLCAGLLLGPIDGALVLLAYLVEGASGLPVFSPTGPGGVAQLLGPTGGYLLADPLVAFTAGWLARRTTAHLPAFPAALLSCLAATTLLYVCGAAWLEHLAHLPTQALWTVSILPYLPGELVKILVAAGMFRTFQARLVR